MEKKATAGLMKISELAKATDTKVSTIKFYVKEGLILAAGKTSPNMAYYHPDCITRIQLIKSLQKDHFYPLSVIKRMLSVTETNQNDIRLLDVIHKADSNTKRASYTLSDITRMTGLESNKVKIAVDTGIVNPVTDRKARYFSDLDLNILLLAKRRADAGIPFEETVETFRVYSIHLEQAAKADVDLFITQTMLNGSASTEQAVRMISVSDETLDSYTNLKRKEYNRLFGSERLEDLEKFSSGLEHMLRYIGESLKQYALDSSSIRCLNALTDCPEDTDQISKALMFYNNTIFCMESNLADSIATSGKANRFFTSVKPQKNHSDEDTVLLLSLKLSWMTLAPSLLKCEETAAVTREEIESFLQKPNAGTYAPLVTGIIKELNSLAI